MQKALFCSLLTLTIIFMVKGDVVNPLLSNNFFQTPFNSLPINGIPQPIFLDCMTLRNQIENIKKVLVEFKNILDIQNGINNQLKTQNFNLKNAQILLKDQIQILKKSQEQFKAQIEKLKITEITNQKTGLIKFSSNSKHPNVQIIADNIVKSSGNGGYEFAIMDKDIENSGLIKTFSFKVRPVSSWLAVGMCHKNIVASKSYLFNHQTTGHGAYMISSNGGSWSNTRPQQNNLVSAFTFTTNDVITVTVDFGSKKIKYQKLGSQYTMSFDTISGDPLHPCVLFYYPNDQIEYVY